MGKAGIEFEGPASGLRSRPIATRDGESVGLGFYLELADKLAEPMSSGSAVVALGGLGSEVTSSTTDV
jgi:hypothetical protein